MMFALAICAVLLLTKSTIFSKTLKVLDTETSNDH